MMDETRSVESQGMLLAPVALPPRQSWTTRHAKERPDEMIRLFIRYSWVGIVTTLVLEHTIPIYRMLRSVAQRSTIVNVYRCTAHQRTPSALRKGSIPLIPHYPVRASSQTP